MNSAGGFLPALFHKVTNVITDFSKKERLMETEVIVSLITLAGSALGTFAGIITSTKLTTYRIEQLEKKVDKHNTVIERTFKLEEAQAVMQEQIKVANHRIEDLEREE